MCVILFVLGFNVAFNTVQVILQWTILWAEETSTYSQSRFTYTVLYTIDKQLPILPHRIRGLNRRPQLWELSVLPLYHTWSLPVRFMGQLCDTYLKSDLKMAHNPESGLL